MRTRDGENQQVEWYQFKIPLSDYERIVGSISDFSTVRFARIFLTGSSKLRICVLRLLSLCAGSGGPMTSISIREVTPVEGELDLSVVNIEENAVTRACELCVASGCEPYNRPGQSQITQLNEQSMSMKVTGLQSGDARAVYRNTSLIYVTISAFRCRYMPRALLMTLPICSR